MGRMNWIKTMFAKYLEDKTVDVNVGTDHKTIEVFTTTSKYRRQSAFSYCHDEDTFDVVTGIVIAYARLINEKIPNCVLYNELKVKDVDIGKMFILKYNHKTYVKVCEHPSYPNEYKCTDTENGETAIISEECDVEKIF